MSGSKSDAEFLAETLGGGCSAPAPVRSMLVSNPAAIRAHLTRPTPMNKPLILFKALLQGQKVDLRGITYVYMPPDGIQPAYVGVPVLICPKDADPYEEVHGVDLDLGSFIRLANELSDEEVLTYAAQNVFNEMREQGRDPRYTCTICHQNSVDSDAGYDTCESCLSRR